MLVDNLTRGIRDLQLFLGISGIQCSFVVTVRAFQTLSNARRLTQDRQAVKTLWKQSRKVRLQFIPRSVRSTTKKSRHMLRVLVMRLLRVIGSLGLRVVHGGMLSVDGSTEMVSALLVAPRSERIGEHGRRKRCHVDDE